MGTSQAGKGRNITLEKQTGRGEEKEKMSIEDGKDPINEEAARDAAASIAKVSLYFLDFFPLPSGFFHYTTLTTRFSYPRVIPHDSWVERALLPQPHLGIFGHKNHISAFSATTFPLPTLPELPTFPNSGYGQEKNEKNYYC